MAPGLFTVELGAGSRFPKQPRTSAALAWIETFLSFSGKGFPNPVTAG